MMNRLVDSMPQALDKPSESQLLGPETWAIGVEVRHDGRRVARCKAGGGTGVLGDEYLYIPIY